MKKTIKGFLLGVIITTILMSTVFGAQVKKTIEVIYNSVNLTVNGSKVIADNILYEGTTYVPLRAVAEALGKDVGWEQATYTASVNDKGTAQPETDLPKQGKSDVTREFQSALKKAESYSKGMNMSKTSVYDQLVSEYGEKFPKEAAQYAIDNVNADWRANALKKAESYSNTMSMSKASVYDQLVSEYGEKFTKEEAKYAIDNVKADWKENALKKAESYSNTMSMSKASVYDQLVSEYGEKFTKEEAQYAIDNLI